MTRNKHRYARSTLALQARLRAAGPNATWDELRAATGLSDAGLARLVNLKWGPPFLTIPGPRGVNPQPRNLTRQGAELTPASPRDSARG